MSSQIKIGALLSYVGIGLNILIGLLYTPWMLHSIGRDNFGLYTLAISVITLFVFDFGLSSAVTRYISMYLAEGRQDKANNCLGLVYKLYFIIDGILFIVLVLVYFFIPNIYERLSFEEIEKFKRVYTIAAVFSVISFPLIPINGVLTANEKFIQIKFCDLLNKILIVVLMSSCLLLGYGLYALVLVNAIAGICMNALKLYFVKKYTNTRINLSYSNSAEKKDILKFSGWTTVISICQRFIFNLAPSILGIMSGTTSIAILGIAITIEGYTYTLASALNGMFLPRISRILAANESDILPLMIRVGRIQTMIIFTIFLVFCCIGRDFIELWVGTEYSDSFCCAVLLILPGLIHLPQEIASTAIVATNNVKYQAYIFVLMSICNIVLAFLFSSKWGAIGISASICIAYFVRTIGMNLIYRSKLKLDIIDFFISTYRHLWIVICIVVGSSLLFNLLFPNINWFVFGLKCGILLIISGVSYWYIYTNQEEKTFIKTIGCVRK